MCTFAPHDILKFEQFQCLIYHLFPLTGLSWQSLSNCFLVILCFIRKVSILLPFISLTDLHPPSIKKQNIGRAFETFFVCLHSHSSLPISGSQLSWILLFIPFLFFYSFMCMFIFLNNIFVLSIDLYISEVILRVLFSTLVLRFIHVSTFYCKLFIFTIEFVWI